MKGCRIYELSDPEDLTILNRMFNRLGIHFETNLFETYVWVDHDQYQLTKIRKAGRNRIADQNDFCESVYESSR